MRVARYIDRTNLTEFFEKNVDQEQPLTKQASHVSHIYYGRMKASKYFFQPPATKKNRKLWDSLRSISDSYRAWQSQRLTVEVLEQAVKDAQAKADEQDRVLGDMISTTALSYITLQHPEVSADEIIKGAKEEHPEVKQALQMACKL